MPGLEEGGGGGKQWCILIVDYYERTRGLLRQWLESLFPECAVIEAESGEDAVVLAKTRIPRLVVMDISLPNMNGIKATQLIKESVPTAKVVLIAMHEDEAHRADAFAAGVSEYVPKRLMQVNLIPALKRLIANG